MPTLLEINQEIMHGNLTNDDLDTIAQAIKFRRGQIGKEIKRAIRVGDTVQFYHPKLGQNLSGPVKSVKIKNVTVATARGLYRVPANLLEIV
jgi:hypothetical protein